MAETHALSSKILLFSRDDLYSTDSSREKKKNDEYQNRVELHGSHREG